MVSQAVPVKVPAWGKAEGRREVRSQKYIESAGDGGKGWRGGCRAGEKGGGFDLKEQKGRERPAVYLSAFLACDFGYRIKRGAGGGRLGG